MFPQLKIKKYSKKPESTGNIPFISCQSTNNGIATYCGEKPEVKNCITISTNGNCFDCFYHPYPIIPSSDVEILYKKGITDNESIALYLCASLSPFSELYSYSHKPKGGKVFNTVISLPVVPSDDPSHTYTSADIDWKYMQDYIAELEQDYIAELDAYLKASNLDDTELTDEEKEVLKGPDKTKEFKIEELFELKHQTYKATKLDFCDYGKTPAYSSDSKNNGCVGYVSHKPEFIVSNDVPTYLVFGDHTRTRNIVHRSFVGMDNIKVLKPKQELSDCCLLYISTAWLKAIPVLGYARHWSVARAAKFLLPVASTGTPDWHFMETYITAIEKLTIKDVVKYKNQMIKTTKQVVNC